MRKIVVTLSILSLCMLDGFAQQLPQISQFADNAYNLNTAIAGKDSVIEAQILNRYQWTGITDAPRTFNLAIQGRIKNPAMGIGGLIYSDNAGPTRRAGVRLSYAHHLNLTSEWKLGLSLAMGALQFSIDGTRIDVDEENDLALFSEKRSQTVFDAGFSALAYRDNFHFGITLPQLLQNRIDLFESTAEENNRLKDHYYIIAGYKYDINSNFTLEPSLLVKYVSPTPLKVDLSARVIYNNMVWLGGTFRTHDAVSAYVGYNHNNQLSIGYAFDMSTTSIKSYSGSTHELTLAFRIAR